MSLNQMKSWQTASHHKHPVYQFLGEDTVKLASI